MISDLEVDTKRVKAAAESQLEFLKMLRELNIDGEIAGLDQILRDELEWFKARGLADCFTSTSKEAENQIGAAGIMVFDQN